MDENIAVSKQSNRRYLKLIAIVLVGSASARQSDVLATGIEPKPILEFQASSIRDVHVEGERLFSAVLFAKKLESSSSAAVCERVWQDLLTQARRTLPVTDAFYRQMFDERSAFLMRNNRTKVALKLFRDDIGSLSSHDGPKDERDRLIRLDIDRILSILKTYDNTTASIAEKEAELSGLDGIDGSVGAKIHKELGLIFFNLRKYEKAELHFKMALNGIDDSQLPREDKASLQMSLAETAIKLGNYRQASLLATEIQGTIEKCLSPNIRCAQLLRLARLEVQVNEFQKAKQLSQQALRCVENSTADATELFSSTYSVAHSLEMCGDATNATRAFERCRELAENGEINAGSRILVLTQLSKLQMRSGNLSGAQSSIERSLQIAKKAGSDALTIQCLVGKMYCLGIRDRRIADATQSELLTLARKNPVKSSRLWAFTTTATFRMLTGDLSGSEAVLSEARDIVGSSANSTSNLYDGMIFMRSGQTASFLGKTALAHSYFAKAETIFSKSKRKCPDDLAQNCWSEAFCYWLENDEVRSKALLRRAHELYYEANMNPSDRLNSSVDFYFSIYCLKQPEVRGTPDEMARLALDGVRNVVFSAESFQMANMCWSLSELLMNAGFDKQSRQFANEANEIRTKLSKKKVG